MQPTRDQILRRCVFRPYRKGMGPVFRLTLWDACRRRPDGKDALGYRLTMAEPGARSIVLFTGEDFGNSPLHAIDSDETVAALMSFLTLRPGDTDREYFRDYTPAQLNYCSEHAEALALEVLARFGER